MGGVCLRHSKGVYDGRVFEGRKFAAVPPDAERKVDVVGTAIGGLLEPMGKRARYSKCAALRDTSSQHVTGRAASAVTYIGDYLMGH
jgi:hypothetical protein